MSLTHSHVDKIIQNIDLKRGRSIQNKIQTLDFFNQRKIIVIPDFVHEFSEENGRGNLV